MDLIVIAFLLDANLFIGVSCFVLFDLIGVVHFHLLELVDLIQTLCYDPAII